MKSSARQTPSTTTREIRIAKSTNQYHHYGCLGFLFMCAVAVLPAILRLLEHQSTRQGTRLRTAATIRTAVDEPRNNLTTTSTSFRLVSMNIAGLQPSMVAPETWTMSDQLEAVTRELLASDPHVLALQECPSADWASQVAALDDYVLIGSVASHAGHVVLLVKKELVSERVVELETPAVMAKLTLSNNYNIHVASIHLEPFTQGSFVRRDEMQQLLKASNATPLIVLGDTNMRDTEDTYYEKESLFRDAWKQLGASELTRYSWDTMDHHDDGSYYNEYYGPSTLQKQRRYDRVYYSTANFDDVLRPADFCLVANHPIPPSRNHFLSDHFGIAVTFQIG